MLLLEWINAMLELLSFFFSSSMHSSGQRLVNCAGSCTFYPLTHIYFTAHSGSLIAYYVECKFQVSLAFVGFWSKPHRLWMLSRKLAVLCSSHGLDVFFHFLQDDGLHDSNKIAAFDFDGTLGNTSVYKYGCIYAWGVYVGKHVVIFHKFIRCIVYKSIII